MALFLAKTNGAFLFPPLYYKIFVGKFMCLTNFGQKLLNSDKVTSRILDKQPNTGSCPASWNEKNLPSSSIATRPSKLFRHVNLSSVALSSARTAVLLMSCVIAANRNVAALHSLVGHSTQVTVTPIARALSLMSFDYGTSTGQAGLHGVPQSLADA